MKLILAESNLGNAKTAGLEDDLHLVGNQYNILLSVFFVPYVLTAPLLGIAGKKYGPNRMLPIMMCTFGSMTLFVAAVKNFGGLSEYSLPVLLLIRVVYQTGPLLLLLTSTIGLNII